jgi:hypothetical protein
MTSILYRNDSRGVSNFGWLDSRHVFSFGDYRDPQRVHFGALRVFNDDIVAPGAGFGTHPHHDMEIISIPLHGVIRHKDSMGHTEDLLPGDVQVMSAGTGLTHSEYNGSDTEPLAFLQIWVIPNARSVQPRYDQVRLADMQRNALVPVVGSATDGLPLWIHQDARLSLAHLDEGATVALPRLTAGRGTFGFVIEGSVTIAGETLADRDSIGVTGEEELVVSATAPSSIVVLDVPMP